MSDHKVYRDPPIAMVAVEVRHSGTDPVTEAGYTAIRQQLRKQWPVQLPDQEVTLDFGSSVPSPVMIECRRFASRDRRTAIAIRPGSTTVETVDYKGWDDLQLTLRAALDVRAEVSEPSGYERVGLTGAMPWTGPRGFTLRCWPRSPTRMLIYDCQIGKACPSLVQRTGGRLFFATALARAMP